MTLSEFFSLHSKCALAFSGGVDSSFLLYSALACGAKLKAYYIKSAFQPQFELDDAMRLAEQLSADICVIPVDVLCHREIATNPSDRCYHCKRVLFGEIARQAQADGFATLIDGTNASDDFNDRPGMRALREMSVLSPLRECGLTKSDIRRLSKDAGLFTWDKPAYACLATRIPTGEEISAEKLADIEQAEKILFSLGFSDFRVRMVGGTAKIQVPSMQMERLMRHRAEIVNELKPLFSAVTLDLEARDE